AATNNVHYTTQKDGALHDVLDCIRRIVPLSAVTAPRKNHEYWLKPPEEMARLHDGESIDAAAWVAKQCRYELPLGEFHFPDPIKTPSILGGDKAPAGAHPSEILAARCREGVARRFGASAAEVLGRLDYELKMIRAMGFCGFFLLVAGIVDHIKKNMGIRCACRGSAAGSLVAYVLGISEVDPVAHDLVFERFMNPYRKEIPDIDIDVESARREEVNNYILKAFPKLSAMVGMMETFQARAAIREAGKALGITQSEIDLISKAFPHISARNIPAALESLPEVAGLNLTASKLEVLFDLASRLDRFPRHLAMHPSGVILSDNNLADLMPMQLSNEGFLTSQFDKDDVETLGLAKLDVLGVRMLSAITHTLGEIQRVRGRSVELESIDTHDEVTFDLIRESRTLGCFQIESPGQRELLGKFQPGRFEDLIID
ncbi:MAG: DNA polymerase III subunit alpha, partial [Actinomycetota bacterium]